ncbi:glycoside hydrolase family 2 TIM barrel-domain containing protein [Loigolactobacillus coryniformis]|uniref:Glycoside hydrolase family 2 protein n=1 Tax=Loigolactobacillus coryniformis TaxID=1610 RepID=A0A5B8TDW6_9LACO|nr:glycoside hydrolase family 2 TIM barrel-domain containing protein [Loigolactobacillus coryniformis]QEA51965.1 glycoside hydrolase family 2 protein [Loigolactobacillus coryniformis]
MRKCYSLNQDWLFHYGAIQEPLKIAKKAYALGGLTSPLPEEAGDRVITSAGGDYFLKLIAQGDKQIGLRNLASTDLTSSLSQEWQKITVPHDWKVAQPFKDEPRNLMSGSKSDTTGYYRRTFSLPANLFQDNRVILHFAGIMGLADFWLNGAYLGQNISGYTAKDFDITEMARYGSEGINALLIKVDTTAGHEGWWYEGAGIYKNVWLEVVPNLHIDTDSLYIFTKQLTSQKATVQVDFTVKNYGAVKQVQPQITIFDQTVNLVSHTLATDQDEKYTATFVLAQPKLWTPGTPNLYTAKVTVGMDTVTQTFGIRTFSYDTTGFYLNQQHYELHGVCEHQDFAGVGIALTQDIVDYKIKILKEMGVNAIRSTHHFASTELLTACDRLGILVINENRLLESTSWRVADLIKMVKQSRNHASIAFWSIANEEVIGNTQLGSRVAKRLVSTIKHLDKERLIISAELLNPEGIVDADYLSNLDVLGVNYPEADVMGSGAKLIKEKYPQQPLMSTENASYFSTRGVYKDDATKQQCSNFGSLYSMILPGKRQPNEPGVGGTAHPETVMTYLKAHAYMGGVFLWSGFDYFGEPSPFTYPAISSQFGVVDTCGFKKDYFYYYKAHWTSKPFVHVMPHWNEAGLDIDAQGNVAIRAFSNLSMAECLVNGKSFGRKVVSDCRVDWTVPYAAGELKIIAYGSHGETIQTVKVTSGSVDSLKTTLLFDGQSEQLYSLTALDKNKQIVPTSNQSVVISVTGGHILGLGNGNPADISAHSLTRINLFNGKALVILKKDTTTITVAATFG